MLYTDNKRKMQERMKEYLKKKTINYSVFWFDLNCKLHGIKKSRIVHKLLKDVGDTDSITNYHEFANKIKKYLGKDFLTIPCYGSESLHYGHINMFYNYAGISERVNAKIFPAIEHGISVRKRDDQELRIYSNFVFQTNYKKEHIQERNTLKPVFKVGPYIHYSEKYYSEEKEKKLKRTYGRILTVFLMHSFEHYDLTTDVGIVKKIMEYGKNDYDTVMVCVYWNDVNKEVYKKFEEAGAVLVSAGYREDSKFMPRLKTILSISDTIVSNGIGTFTGYARYMNKPVEILAIDSVDKQPDMFRKYFELFPHGNLSDELERKQEEFINFYWGSKRDILSREQMKNLITLNEKIYETSKGIFDKYDSTIELMLESDNLLRAEEKELLIESIKR